MTFLYLVKGQEDYMSFLKKYDYKGVLGRYKVQK